MSAIGKKSLNLTKEKSSAFEKHPIVTIIFINLFFIFIWLAIDLIYSNFISSFTHTYEVFKSVKPVGHANVENKTFRWQSRHKGEYDAEVTLNNLGFRNNEDFNEQSIKDKKVIFAIGDSTTAAFENSYKASYPKVLNDTLGKETIVFNTGVRGFDTNQVVINYQTQLRKLKPDAVIYMICENDLEGNVNAELYSKIMRYYGKGLVNTKDRSFIFIEPVKGIERRKISIQTFVAKNFQLSFKKIYMPLTALLRKKPTVPAIKKDNFDPEKLKKLEELLVILNDLTKEDGIPLFITWFPYLTKGSEENTTIPQYYKKTRAFVEENLKNSLFISTYEPLLRYYQQYPSTKKSEFLFPYNMHATDFGSIKMSKLIGDVVKTELY